MHLPRAVVLITRMVVLNAENNHFGGGSRSSTYMAVSAKVEAYDPTIRKYAQQYGIPEYVELIKAVMMQESGGRGLDPMQAAEGGFNTRYPHEPNGIADPKYSVECDVQELKAALEAAGVETPWTWSGSSWPCRAITLGVGTSPGPCATTAVIPSLTPRSFLICRQQGWAGAIMEISSMWHMSCATTPMAERSVWALEIRPPWNWRCPRSGSRADSPTDPGMALMDVWNGVPAL